MNRNPRKDGWGGRIRTHGWRDQNPLPYRLATPQLKARYKNTIFPYILGVTLFFFLFLTLCALPSWSQEELIKNPLQTPITSLRSLESNNKFIYSCSGKLFSNQNPINFPASTIDNEFEIYQINTFKDDFYLSTTNGTYKNFRRIFSRESSFHFQATSKEYFLSGLSGIYRAENNINLGLVNWTLMSQSPPFTRFFQLNKSKSNPEFAASDYGFYYYNPRSHEWLNRSHGLNHDFEDSYGLGRFLVIHEKNKTTVLLPSSNGIYISFDKGLNWTLINRGLKANPDGFFSLRELKIYKDLVVLIGSTGLYYAPLLSFKDEAGLNFQFAWKKLNISKSEKNLDLNQDFHSIDIMESPTSSELDFVLVGNSQGQIFKIFYEDFSGLKDLKSQDLEAFTPEEKNIELSIEKSRLKRINEILDSEPDLEELHKVALAFAGIPTGERFSSYRMQARLRNLMPNFEAFVEKDTQDYLSIESSGEDSFSSSTSSISTSLDEININRNDDQINTGIRFKWNLTNLIYDPEITDINNSARITANIRENILTEINQIYFARKELLLKLLKENINSNLSINKLKLDEYTAQLDARTGHWFSKQIKEDYLNGV